MSLGYEIHAGDIVRFEHERIGIWFYCRVVDAYESGKIVCTVVDSQSWPDLALEGILPGRIYTLHSKDVLSVVHTAGH